MAEEFLDTLLGQCQLVGVVAAPVPALQTVVEGVSDSNAEAELEVVHAPRLSDAHGPEEEAHAVPGPLRHLRETGALHFHGRRSASPG